MNMPHNNPQRQRGFVLLMTLIMLFMLTTLALTEATLNSTQTRISTNATNSEIAFQTAEGTLNEAINNLMKGTYNVANFANNDTGFYTYNEAATPLWKTVNWSSSSAVIPSFQGSSGAQSNFIIEKLPSVIMPGQSMAVTTNVYRITARATQTNSNTAVVLQSTIQIQ
ncbi:pilus assembly PilX family protein [Legionella spiritensis]|uniref:Tfp pilus assembly protein PilX n=1 Tax=Legionella spiritensis TaxID=452 RepID=A0A0W0YW33_LEGSP|nr:pilus assembly protein PilX [Legionella spiritensis]KTD61120.1 Tfp pilus assembly protein PilX [Legionella spiritensis]SNV45022.1 type IV pilus assembly protein PilX [Legionella spiritensis]